MAPASVTIRPPTTRMRFSHAISRPLVSLEDVVERRAGFEVLEDDGNRHPGVFEHPGSTDLAGHTSTAGHDAQSRRAVSKGA